MTDTSVRNVLFDPRCGWVLISNGVYLGISKVTGRSAALRQLQARELATGLRSPVGRSEVTQGRQEARESGAENWNEGKVRGDTYRRIAREQR